MYLAYAVFANMSFGHSLFCGILAEVNEKQARSEWNLIQWWVRQDITGDPDCGKLVCELFSVKLQAGVRHLETRKAAPTCPASSKLRWTEQVFSVGLLIYKLALWSYAHKATCLAISEDGPRTDQTWDTITLST